MAARRWWQRVAVIALALLVLVLALIAAFALGVVLRPPAASASSEDTIQIIQPTPGSNGKFAGPMDTLIGVTLIPAPSSTTENIPYQLRVLTTVPTIATCASAPPLPGVQPVDVFTNTPGVPGIQFHWPTSLGTGTYWFCAIPVNGSGATLMSPASESFTVLTSKAPQVTVEQSTSPIELGGTVMVRVTNWITSDAQDPQIAANSGSVQGSPLMVQGVQRDVTTSTDTLQVILPTNFSPGSYTLTAWGECPPTWQGATGPFAGCAISETSQPFAVTLAPTPTTVPSVQTAIAGAYATQNAQETQRNTGSTTSDSADSVKSVLPILAAEGLIALILFAVAARLYLKRRQETPAAHARDQWSGSPDESDHFRREPLPRRTKSHR